LQLKRLRGWIFRNSVRHVDPVVLRARPLWVKRTKPEEFPKLSI
jgi:hypothetical protein